MIQIFTTNLVNDVINLIDHLKLENIRLIGYSMGTVIALDLLSTHPEYFSKAVIATGDGLIGLPLLYLKIFYSVLQICFHMRLFQSLAKSYFCILEFFKQIGLEKNL
jgi:pimeloyl-ACP methyl ester carboxylesterase